MFKAIILAVLATLGFYSPKSAELPIQPELGGIDVISRNLATTSDLGVEDDILSFPSTTTPTTQDLAKESHLCSCVAHARKFSPYSPPRVKQASEIPAIQFTPKVGGWVLMDIPPYGHAGVVTKILGDKIEITESNYPIACQESVRTISIDDKSIRGYFWHSVF